MPLVHHLHIRRLGSIVLTILLILSSLATAGARVSVDADECCDPTEARDTCSDFDTSDCAEAEEGTTAAESAENAGCDDEHPSCRGICHCCATLGCAIERQQLPALSIDERDHFPAAQPGSLATRSLPVDHPPC